MAINENTKCSNFRVAVEVKRLGGAYGGKTTRNNVFAAACGLAAYVTNRLVNCKILKTLARSCKTFFMRNSVEHGNLNAHKYKNIKKCGVFLAQISLKLSF